MFYPRLSLHDRLRGRDEVFAPCGVVAGQLAAADARAAVWKRPVPDEGVVRAPAQLAAPVSEQQRERLASLGVNTLQTVRGGADVPELRTLVPDLAARPELRALGTRRLAQRIVTSVVTGTRWVLLETPGDALRQRLRAQIEAFLEPFAQHGALAGACAEDSYFVICDERLNAVVPGRGAVQVLFGFAPLRPAEFLAYLITHTAGGSTVRAVSVSRAATHRRRSAEEIETAILQGLIT